MSVSVKLNVKSSNAEAAECPASVVNACIDVLQAYVRASGMYSGTDRLNIRDGNGNTIGSCTITTKPEKN